MRKYNIVRPSFWAWAKEKDLSPAARELALYCLTSPHTTSIGCFRLPIAYIVEDLGAVPDTVRHTVSELTKVGFLKHDDSTGWIWIVGFLDHNPIANGNVGKSLVPFVEAVPKKVPFYVDFLHALAKQSDRFPDGFIDRLRNSMPNGSGNGMPTHEHDHDHDHEHDHDRDREADAPPGAGDQQPSPSPEPIAYAAFVEAATRQPRWPVPEELNLRRHEALSARIKEVGGLDGFLAVLAKAERSTWICNEMKGWGLDWFLKSANFAKVREGNYDDGKAAENTSRRESWADTLP
jgi:hypothetical protein